MVRSKSRIRVTSRHNPAAPIALILRGRGQNSKSSCKILWFFWWIYHVRLSVTLLKHTHSTESRIFSNTPVDMFLSCKTHQLSIECSPSSRSVKWLKHDAPSRIASCGGVEEQKRKRIAVPTSVTKAMNRTFSLWSLPHLRNTIFE